MTRTTAQVISMVALGACVAIGGCATGPARSRSDSGPGGGDAGGRTDSGARIGDGGGIARGDSGSTEDRDAAVTARPGEEACGDGLDGDLDGTVDETCGCGTGDTQPCFLGDPALAGVGACAMGTQSCEPGVEFGTWGECTGSALPAIETCDGADEDCDGIVDEGTSTGDACGTAVGACAAGTEACVDGAIACLGRTGPVAEICMNMIDDDCDGMVDEGCTCLDAGTSPWQQYLDRGVHCFGSDLDMDVREFSFARIPGATDGVWDPRTLVNIDFNDSSFVSGEFCDADESHDGGIFSYFQTFVTVSSVPATATISIGSPIDDGAQVHVFSAGACASGCLVGTTFTGGATYNIRSRLVVGRNRIVVTHVDDNPTGRRLNTVRVLIDGRALAACD